MASESMPSPDSKRILGYDVARAFAILGMVLVNFKIVLTGLAPDPTILTKLVGLIEGRAAATFVVLAGVGMSLMARKGFVSGDTTQIAEVRRKLLKRAIFLVLVGLAYTPIWPADILHFYGVYILFTAFIIAWPSRRIVATACVIPFIFIILLLVFDYEKGWNWQTLSYSGLWTWSGMIRHILFNGFHPIIPWSAFLIFGLWLGRQNLQEHKLRQKIMAWALVTMVVTEAISKALLFSIKKADPTADLELVNALFGSSPMPPMPWFVFSAGGLAVAFICLCVSLTERFPNLFGLRALVLTGQLAFTHYVAHVIIGMGTLEALGMLEHQTTQTAVVASFTFFAAAIIFSIIWRKFFKRGPLEFLMRKLTG